jgi:hypothetical protein
MAESPHHEDYPRDTRAAGPALVRRINQERLPLGTRGMAPGGHPGTAPGVPMVSYTIGADRYEVELPLTPAEAFFASPQERLDIALDAHDAIDAEHQGSELGYSRLRDQIIERTGLDWAVAHLAIDVRGKHRLFAYSRERVNRDRPT